MAHGGSLMSVPLTEVLKELRQDHRNIESLLELVDAEAERISTGGEPDCELLKDIMQYMLVYSDGIHHPREDLVYQAMAKFSGELAQGLEGVEPDHHEIGQLGKALHRDIEAVLVGAPVTRERVATDAVDYVKRLRNHMAWEEADLFLQADRLAEQSDVNIDVSRLTANDPIFGADKDPAFSILLANLARRSPI